MSDAKPWTMSEFRAAGLARAREEQRATDADAVYACEGRGRAEIAAAIRSAPLDKTPLQDRIRELEENNRKSFDLLVNTKASVAALREGLRKLSEEFPASTREFAAALLASENPGKGFVGPETVAQVKALLREIDLLNHSPERAREALALLEGGKL